MRFGLLAAVAALGATAAPAPAQFTIRPLNVAPLNVAPLYQAPSDAYRPNPAAGPRATGFTIVQRGYGPSYGYGNYPGYGYAPAPGRAGGFTVLQRPLPGYDDYDSDWSGGARGGYYHHYARPQGRR